MVEPRQWATLSGGGKQREHHVQLLLRRALQKLRLAKPETFADLIEEVGASRQVAVGVFFLKN